MIIQIFSGFMILGLIFTFFLPETKGKTLEELSGEDDHDNHTEISENKEKF